MLSAGIDGVIKAWEVLSSPGPGMVLKPEPDFVFDKAKPEEGPRRAKVSKITHPTLCVEPFVLTRITFSVEGTED